MNNHLTAGQNQEQKEKKNPGGERWVFICYLFYPFLYSCSVDFLKKSVWNIILLPASASCQALS
jgi:hypothetical protein